MKRGFRIAGAAVAVAAGAYFVHYTLQALAGHDLSELVQPRVMLAGALLTAAYTLLIPITAFAWGRLLRGLGQPAGFELTGPILATTQFGKYLPGNVAHHLGRVAMARACGLEARPTILSMAYETLLTLVACAHVSALALLWTPPAGLADLPLAAHRGPLIIVISLGAIAAMIAAPRLATWIAQRRSSPAESLAVFRAHPGWVNAFHCYLLYATNFVLVGIGLWLVARTLTSESLPALSIVLFVGAFASSWILGFLAPGAPAGLGVREAVLALLLGNTLTPSVAVTVIVMLRIATTLGDLLSFLWGSAAFARRRARSRRASSSSPQP